MFKIPVFIFLLSRGAKCSVVRFSIALSGVWCLIHFGAWDKRIKKRFYSQQWASPISGFFFHFLLIFHCVKAREKLMFCLCKVINFIALFYCFVPEIKKKAIFFDFSSSYSSSHLLFEHHSSPNLTWLLPDNICLSFHPTEN